MMYKSDRFQTINLPEDVTLRRIDLSGFRGGRVDRFQDFQDIGLLPVERRAFTGKTHPGSDQILEQCRYLVTITRINENNVKTQLKGATKKTR